MANGKKGLLGKKMGMTQLFTDDGAATAVTVIDLSSNTVIRVKTAESADGYDAVQIGIEPKRAHSTNKAEAGEFAKAGVVPASTCVSSASTPTTWEATRPART